jgi:uncharacterized protein YeaC (DUF1315 family)
MLLCYASRCLSGFVLISEHRKQTKNSCMCQVSFWQVKRNTSIENKRKIHVCVKFRFDKRNKTYHSCVQAICAWLCWNLSTENKQKFMYVSSFVLTSETKHIHRKQTKNSCICHVSFWQAKRNLSIENNRKIHVCVKFCFDKRTETYP